MFLSSGIKCPKSYNSVKKQDSRHNLEITEPLSYLNYKLKASSCELQLVIFHLYFITAICFKSDERLYNSPESVLMLFRS